MASILRVNTLTDASSNNSIAMSFVSAGSAKAYANVDTTGTAALDGNFNISGLTDNGTGEFTLAISSDMGNTNYSFTTGFNDQASDQGPVLKVTSEAAMQTGQISFQKKE